MYRVRKGSILDKTIEAGRLILLVLVIIAIGIEV